MKKLVAILFVVIALACVIVRKQTVSIRVTGAPSTAQSALNKVELEKTLTLVKKSRQGAEQSLLIENFLSIDLSNGGARSQQALLILHTALLAKDTLIKQEALQQTHSLLIDVSHGRMPIHSSLRRDLNDLFRTYKSIGSLEIRKVAAVNPHSPTLTYLQSLR
ncbi:hypothetical protein [Bdellovibrio sp. HCB2-146]|uniref:hypothetical protein n=1 Tax=Bdellovibrio sp. HCB2-146 TaxID=3394362 RepID=UPI0039BCF0CB